MTLIRHYCDPLKLTYTIHDSKHRDLHRGWMTNTGRWLHVSSLIKYTNEVSERANHHHFKLDLQMVCLKYEARTYDFLADEWLISTPG